MYLECKVGDFVEIFQIDSRISIERNKAKVVMRFKSGETSHEYSFERRDFCKNTYTLYTETGKRLRSI
jgi:bifunctional DNA-binding transcriptional regulator/antitoxin component of YhaV-PrlF toxin-antitoxin module